MPPSLCLSTCPQGTVHRGDYPTNVQFLGEQLSTCWVILGTRNTQVSPALRNALPEGVAGVRGRLVFLPRKQVGGTVRHEAGSPSAQHRHTYGSRPPGEQRLRACGTKPFRAVSAGQSQTECQLRSRAEVSGGRAQTPCSRGGKGKMRVSGSSQLLPSLPFRLPLPTRSA